ncbi:unnamed protein product [Eruca vesicaria subsp. sativa]|uniref:Uncharacterized protein n=1 Tax=Eruca vesicaria subsp. sativa TaxID=29727 RepID=A0ABC8L4X1_ERUVS|nr:unnamed protein product [Eruca vesicaria subsp. sativa]
MTILQKLSSKILYLSLFARPLTFHTSSTYVVPSALLRSKKIAKLSTVDADKDKKDIIGLSDIDACLAECKVQIVEVVLRQELQGMARTGPYPPEAHPN